MYKQSIFERASGPDCDYYETYTYTVRIPLPHDGAVPRNNAMWDTGGVRHKNFDYTNHSQLGNKAGYTTTEVDKNPHYVQLETDVRRAVDQINRGEL